MAKKIQPLTDRILIRPIKEEDTYKGNLYIPDNAKEKPQEGEVLAVGYGVRCENGQVFPLVLAIGDHVLFGKYSGTEIVVNEEPLLVMRESEILGIIYE